MAALTYQKIRITTVLMTAAAVITLPNVFFGILLEFIHLMNGLMHFVVETLEFYLGQLIEYLFRSNPKKTQAIVFCLLTIMALGGIYFLILKTVRLLRKIKVNTYTALLDGKMFFLNYWAGSAGNKFKMIALLHVGLTCLVIFGF